jgi:hypothetical protein
MHCTVHATTLLLLAPQPMLFVCDLPITSNVAYIPSAANTSIDFNVLAFVVCDVPGVHLVANTPAVASVLLLFLLLVPDVPGSFFCKHPSATFVLAAVAFL